MLQRCYGVCEDSSDRNENNNPKYYIESPFNRVDLSRYVQNTYDQETIGSSAACAVCVAVGIDLKIMEERGFFDSYFSPSRLFLFQNTKTNDKSERSIYETIRAFNDNGVCSEEDWPYDVKNSAMSLDPCNTTGSNTLDFKRLDQDLNQLRACLQKGHPFVFGLTVYKSFHKLKKKNNWILKYKFGEPRSGGRLALTAVGFSESKRTFKVLNNWGREWGNGGYFFLPYYMVVDETLCFDFWKITIKDGVSNPFLVLNREKMIGQEGAHSRTLSKKTKYSKQRTGLCLMTIILCITLTLACLAIVGLTVAYN